jgi:hypothetical protein
MLGLKILAMRAKRCLNTSRRNDKSVKNFRDGTFGSDNGVYPDDDEERPPRGTHLEETSNDRYGFWRVKRPDSDLLRRARAALSVEPVEPVEPRERPKLSLVPPMAKVIPLLASSRSPFDPPPAA